MKILLKWVASALGLMLVSSLLPNFVIESFYTALVLSLILGILNVLIKPVLVIFTLPINILTLGLFSFVINAGLIWFASTFVKGFSTDFQTALIASVIIWFISLVSNVIFK